MAISSITVICLLAITVSHLGKAENKAANGLDCITLSDDTKTRVCTGTNKEYIGNSLSECTAFQQTYAPTLLTNKAGQERYIYQDEDYGFKQTVRIVTCVAGPCAYGGQCKQTYRDYTLISWDPYLDYYNPVLDVFSVPDCCGCGQGHGHGHGRPQPARPH